MPKNICVYCSSSNAVAPVYFKTAEELGRRLAERGDTLVYGGSTAGTMGALAKSAQQHGGKVVGIIPQVLWDLELAYEQADELLVTRDLRERKGMMESRADAFIALPGGIGTLEEVAEVLALKSLKIHSKPIILMNVGGFYEPLVSLFDHMDQAQFMRHGFRDLYYLAPDVTSALDYLDGHA
jgi:uncharacterized protein (TIGR00730 family)